MWAMCEQLGQDVAGRQEMRRRQRQDGAQDEHYQQQQQLSNGR
jgi:hypothetical protein